ncbi:E3 ubiquitin-protein ligase UPL1-like [Primulina huaijiensis]|uniref:E3 ubiquitin-protein ligase UPL1-like n=1 Tax=Primulina huaijiensis TaxID=1492673 RepID=UPI003CC71020
MKLKRRRALEVTSKIKTFINNVTATPPENIEDSLKSFFWVFDKRDFHHWADLFNHFDTYFEKYIKPRKDLQLEDNSLESDPPFPREAVLHILRVIRIILENCTNKHLYNAYEVPFFTIILPQFISELLNVI